MIVTQSAIEHATDKVKLKRDKGKQKKKASPESSKASVLPSMAQIDRTVADVDGATRSDEVDSATIATDTAGVSSSETNVDANENAGSDLTTEEAADQVEEAAEQPESVISKDIAEPTEVVETTPEAEEDSTNDEVAELTEVVETTPEVEEDSTNDEVAEPSTEVEETAEEAAELAELTEADEPTEEIEEVSSEATDDAESSSDDEKLEVLESVSEEEKKHEHSKKHDKKTDTAKEKSKTMEFAKSGKHAEQTKGKQTDAKPRKSLKSEEKSVQEHEGLPTLKAWTLMSRFFHHLHASFVAFQGGSPEDVALIAQSPQEATQPSTAQVFSSLLIWSFLVSLVAYFYTNRKEKPGSADADKQNDGVEVFQEWKHGLLSCHEAPEVTMCSLCCPGIRWALTLSYVPGMMSFWVAFFIFMSVQSLGLLTAGTIGWVLLALLCAAYRQELRQKFNMEHQGGMTYITDTLMYCFCICCAIAQEARHVEDALKSGHPALQESEKMETTAAVAEGVGTAEEA